MAVYDFEEQEKIDGLKAWWKTYGTIVIIGIAVFIAAVAGKKVWDYYQGQQSTQVAELFNELQEAEAARDTKKTSDAARQLMEGYPDSGYAARAALIAARASLDAGDAPNAKSRLQWVQDHARESELKDIGRLRMAGILLDEKKFDEALGLLAVQHGESFDGLYADLKGDVLDAKGKKAEAREAYQVALSKTDHKGSYYNIVQMKLDALGEAR